MISMKCLRDVWSIKTNAMTTIFFPMNAVENIYNWLSKVFSSKGLQEYIKLFYYLLLHLLAAKTGSDSC